MRARLVIACIKFSFASVVYGGDAETVGEKSYIHIQTIWNAVDIFSNRAALDAIGFSENYSKISDHMKDFNLFRDVINHPDYGGVIMWAGHGDPGIVFCEGYVTEDSAKTRMLWLYESGVFKDGDLYYDYDEGALCYGVYLTTQGIRNTYSGDNSIALIATCDGYSTGGTWGGRVKVSYKGIVYWPTVKSEMTTLLDNLTAKDNDISKMTVNLAMNGDQEKVGDDNTALIPWVEGATPSNRVLQEGANTVTVDFGTKMDNTANPFTVDDDCEHCVFGNCTIDENRWNGESQAILKITCTRASSFNVKLEAARIQSDEGISLLEDWVETFRYDKPVEGSWGEIKSLFNYSCNARDGGACGHV
ncbi:MAG: hypothetical protein JSV33_09755 [bacterium]|nr:MAG: hypothetical protein JSV33_09755 [bacterium]